MISISIEYLNAGLCVLPAIITPSKQPALTAWRPYQTRLPEAQQVRNWFSDAAAMCVVAGAVSGNLEMIDFDQRAAVYNPWRDLVANESPGLLERLVIETSMSGGKHVIYRCQDSIPGNRKLAERYHFLENGDPVELFGKRYKPHRVEGRWAARVTLIETRGEGGIFLCDPSPGYRLDQGSMVELPDITSDERDILIEAARSLTEITPPVVGAPARTDMVNMGRPGDDYNARGDVRSLLSRHGWTLTRPGENEYWLRPGKEHGNSATLRDNVFYVFSSNAAPFEPDRAYSPFAVYSFLEHEGDFSQAAAALLAEGYGMSNSGVDVSRLVCAEPAEAEQEPTPYPDPGTLPEELLRIPGFVTQVMDHNMATAPYPNVALSFCGALCLQALLAGRKVRDRGNLRTNLYLLALANSAVGKDWPRKINVEIMHRLGMVDALGDKFASGEGIQDALYLTPAMLFQTDEIDGLLQSINKARDAKYESIITTLLTIFTSASTMYPMRRKAGKELAGVIDQPCLTIFGTAIPIHFYKALSERLLTNGFIARNLIIESGNRGQGQNPGNIDPPDHIMEVASWWEQFSPGTGNLQSFHPNPRIVDANQDALDLIQEQRRTSDSEYANAEARGDQVGMTVWGRVAEHVSKLALLYAVSANHQSPSIDTAAVRWASSFVNHQTRRMLFMADSHVAETPFEADCLKVKTKLREAPGRTLGHSTVLKRMKMDARSFDTLITTLVQRGEVEMITHETPGRPQRSYRLLE